MPDLQSKENSANAVGQSKRSTPVRPAIWMTGVLVWATVIALMFDVPVWAGIFLCSMTGLSFLLFLVSYIYLMVTDRDALRRERYSVKELPGRDPASLPQPQLGLATQSLSHDAALLSEEKKQV
jgi:cobalamin biosynthesis protein CobD/CbiB